MMPTASAVFLNPALSQNSPLGVFTIGNDGRILSYNPRAIELWGQRPALGQDFYYNSFRCFSMNGGELGAHETPMAIAILKGLPTPETEAIVERSDGSRAIWCLRVEPIFDGQRKILGAVAYFRRKEESNSPLLFLSEEHLPTLIGYLGSDLRFRFANAAYEKWFGLSEQEVVGRSLIEVIGAEAYAEIAPELRLALDGSTQEFERFIPTAAGNNRFLLLRLVPDTAPGGFVRGTAIIGSDVTASRREELEEISQRKKFEAATTAARIGTWSWDRKIGTVSWSASVREILGLEKDQKPLTPEEYILRCVPQEFRLGLRAELSLGIDGGKRFRLEFPVEDGRGQRRWLGVEGFAAKEESYPIVVGMVQDISETKLRSATPPLAHPLNRLADAIPQIVWAFDGQRLELNARWWEYTGDSPSQDPDTMQFVHPEDRAAVETIWARCMAEAMPFEAKYRLRRQDGVYRWHLGRILPVRVGTAGKRPSSWYGTATDVHDHIA